jgi:riboflavin biosynthesis RibT protein
MMRQEQEKTVMGLLALLPGLKEIDHLRAEIDWYANDPARDIFVWQSDDTQQIKGVLGVEKYDETISVVRHISISPEMTTSDMHQMLDEYQQLFPNRFMMGSLQTQPIITEWSKRLSVAQD